MGSGKGGLRLAPDDLIPSILGVPLGSVTPLALAHPPATDVVLLLDHAIQSQSLIYVHPMNNSASLGLTPAQLEAFLTSLGRRAVWVDFSASPPIDRENPPDLRYLAEEAKPIVSKDGEEGGEGGAGQAAGAAPGAEAAKVPAAKKSGGKGAPATAEPLLQAVPRVDVYPVTESVMAKAAAGLGQDLGAVDGEVMRRLRADVAMELNALRNAAYAAGFKAAQASVVAGLTSTQGR